MSTNINRIESAEYLENDETKFDPHLLDTLLRYAVTDRFRDDKPANTRTSPLPNYKPYHAPVSQNMAKTIDKETASQIEVVADGRTKNWPLSANLALQNKIRMMYFHINFDELTNVSLIETGAIFFSGRLYEVQALARQTLLSEEATAVSHFFVAHGLKQLQNRIKQLYLPGTVHCHNEQRTPILGFTFLQLNMRQGVLNFSLSRKHWPYIIKYQVISLKHLKKIFVAWEGCHKMDWLGPDYTQTLK